MAAEGKRKIRRLWTPEEDQLVKELFAKSETFWAEYFQQEDDKKKATKGIEVIIATSKKKAKNNNRTNIKGGKSGPKSIFGRIAYVMRAQERTSKQVRERWINHLAPGIVKEFWTPEEDQLILDQYQCVGPKWVEIAKNLPGRTDNHVKNRWNQLTKSKPLCQINGGRHVPVPREAKRNKSKITKEKALSGGVDDFLSFSSDLPVAPHALQERCEEKTNEMIAILDPSTDRSKLHDASLHDDSNVKSMHSTFSQGMQQGKQVASTPPLSSDIFYCSVSSHCSQVVVGEEGCTEVVEDDTNDPLVNLLKLPSDTLCDLLHVLYDEWRDDSISLDTMESMTNEDIELPEFDSIMSTMEDHIDNETIYKLFCW